MEIVIRKAKWAQAVFSCMCVWRAHILSWNVSFERWYVKWSHGRLYTRVYVYSIQHARICANRAPRTAYSAHHESTSDVTILFLFQMELWAKYVNLDMNGHIHFFLSLARSLIYFFFLINKNNNHIMYAYCTRENIIVIAMSTYGIIKLFCVAVAEPWIFVCTIFSSEKKNNKRTENVVSIRLFDGIPVSSFIGVNHNWIGRNEIPLSKIATLCLYLAEKH